MKHIGRGIFIALILVVLALAGCGGGKETGKPGGGEEKTQKKSDQNQMNPQPRDNVQQGGKLVWPIDAMPANFNYFQIDGTVLDGAFIINAIMPMIFTFDASAAPTYDPDYLAGEPKLVSSPKQIVTYELNPKAIWYDGTAITAADFIAQWKASNGSNHAYQISSSSGYDQIETVAEGSSKFEVVVTFKKPYADWKALFQPLYPASTNNDPKVFNTGWKNTFLTSGGPFKFQGYDATAKIYTIVPNEKWWGNKPKLDSIVFRVIDTDAQPTALASGEIDMMEIGPSIDYYNKAKSIPGVDIRVAGGPNFRHITMNSQSEVLKDVRVRQALAMAIDRSAIAKVELGPLPVVPTSLGNHIFMQNQAGYQDNSSVVSYNPEKAKQLLDAAGWVVKNGKRTKDGKTLIVRLVIPAAVAALSPAAHGRPNPDVLRAPARPAGQPCRPRPPSVGPDRVSPRNHRPALGRHPAAPRARGAHAARRSHPDPGRARPEPRPGLAAGVARSPARGRGRGQHRAGRHAPARRMGGAGGSLSGPRWRPGRTRGVRRQLA